MKIDTRYKILSKISENNNNTLYRVSDKKTGQIISLKFLKNLDADHITRFRREYFILQTLIHPNIVKVFDIGSTKYQQKEHPYFTMEFVDGIQVNHYFKINGFKNFITLFLDILRTINFIHKKGLLHSDLKPHHILITKNGMIKLVDFGFALFQKSKLYKEFGGTLRYIAPEILKGENPDVRSEIYSLGIILYECLSGKDAFGERTIKNIIESVLYKSLPPIIKKKNVPGFINQIIMKMSDKLRMNRYPNIESVIEEVENKGKVSKKRKNIEKVLYSDFIGRKEYLDITYDLLKKSANNNGQILLVEGITGIGKTRLLKEIEYRLFLQGETVQYKRVAEKEEFNFDWLMQFLKRSDINLTSITDEYSNGSLNLSGNRKYIFFEKVERVLSQISSEKVQVIIIDEINTGYKIIWEFLLYISSFIEKIKILIIGATERVPEEFIKTSKQGAYENIKKLSLKGLNKEEAIHLIGNLLGVSENVENLAAFLYEKTEGNPYFIEELLKELVERRLLKKSANNLIYGLSELKIIPIPENVETFVQNRLKKLSDEEKEILKIAAVYGESIPVLSLIALSPLNELNTTKISEHLYLSQFFSIYNDEYNFSHKILRKIIYNEIKENERILIHKKVFEFLKALKETPLLINQKAHHAYSAGMPEAKSLLLRALKIAIKSNNYDNAVDAFKKLQDTSETFLFEKVEIDSIIKIGYFYTLLGNLGDAILLFESYLPRVIKKEGKVKVLHRLAVVKTIACEYNKAERIYEDLLKITRKTDMKFEVLLDRGWLYFVKGDYAEAEGNYKVALSMSEKITNKVLLCRLFTNLGILKLQTELFSDANEYGKKSLVYSKRFKNQSYINAALNLLGRIEQQRKRFKEAILYYKKVLKSLEKSKDILRALSIFMSLSNCYYQLGKYDLCEENLFKAINLARKLGKLYEIAFLYNLSGSLNLRKGRWQSADDYFTKSLEIGFSINNYIIQFCNLIDISLISVLRGKKDRFKEYLEKANKLRKDVTDEKELLSLYLVKGIEKYIAEDYKKCISYISNIENTIENIKVPEYQIPALIYKGLSLSKINKKNEALDAVKIAKRMVHKHNFDLYEEEAELAEIEIISDEVTVELRKRLNKLLSDTDKKKEKFLHARGLMLLSDIKLKEFNGRKSRSLLTASINSLKEAKKIFQDIDAQPFIANINSRFSELFDVFLQYGDVELKSKKYLEIMKELGKTIINLGNLDELKERFLSLAKSITGAERGLFLTFEPDTEDFAITGKDMDIATINDAKRISKSVIQKVRITKKPIISYDAVQDRRFGKNESVLINEIRSLLCIPIISDDSIFGTLYLDSREKPGLFSKEDRDFFSSLSNLLAGTLKNALEYKKMEEEAVLLKKNLRTRFGPKNIVGKSEKIQEVFDQIEKAAKTDIPVLILGETGTGKELVTGSIHLLSKRKDNIFSIVDCLAIPSSLLEAELFGHTKGAFTGADNEKKGMLEASNDGTLFIDEIGDASHAVQSNLLRFLDSGEVKKIGATKYVKVDTRIIAATNKDIHRLVTSGQFREDLFYRLNRFVIKLPPLRVRRDDIKLLLDYFIDLFNKKYNKNIKGVTTEAFGALYKYDWPGNVREFESEIERCVLTCNSSLISKELLSPIISKLPSYFLPLKEMERISRLKYIQNILNFTSGNVSKAAEILKIDRKTIQRIIKQKE